MRAISRGGDLRLLFGHGGGFFLSFAVWRPLLSLAGMARSYRGAGSMFRG
jgi:hypothetical protein